MQQTMEQHRQQLLKRSATVLDMAITRPEKPPLIPAQQAAAVVAAQGGGGYAAPATSARPAYTIENMPIDVMTVAPEQPPLPGSQTIMVLPQEPVTPQLPNTTYTIPDPDRPTPQIIDMPGGLQTVTADPASEPITTEEAMNSGNNTGMPTGALLSVPVVAAAIQLARRPGRNGSAGRQQLDEMGVSIDGEILDPEKARIAGLIDAQGDIIEGTVNRPQIAQTRALPAPDGIEAISEGADDSSSTRTDQSTGAARRASRTGAIPDEAAAPDVADTAPARPAAPVAGDEASRPIATEDIIPQTDAARGGNSAVRLPEGFMPTNSMPPATAVDQRTIAARKTEADVRLDRATGDVWAQQPDGTWSVRRGSGRMQPMASPDHPSNQAWRAARQALKRAIR